MEMLYRLSYVGFDDRDVQVGSTARMKKAVSKYCTGSLTTWLSVLGSKDALPRGDFHASKVVGESCEPGNLIPATRAVNRKIIEFRSL